MESALRPRDIQARIRGGETAESVAAAAGTTVEKIMPFANPVLAERAHVAQTALRASVRRSTGPTGGARTLGDSVGQFLAGAALREDDVAWDAWRRPDGRWALTAQVETDGRTRSAEFTHDVADRYVVAENDDARLLTGELRPDAGDGAPTRPLSALAGGLGDPVGGSGGLGDDAIELVRDQPVAPEPAAASAPAPAEPDPAVLPEADPVAATGPQPDLAADPGPDPEPADRDEVTDDSEETVEVRTGADPSTDDIHEQPELDLGVPEQPPAASSEPAAEPASAEDRPKRRKGRASVPSWDEIMFGGGPSRD